MTLEGWGGGQSTLIVDHTTLNKCCSDKPIGWTSEKEYDSDFLFILYVLTYFSIYLIFFFLLFYIFYIILYFDQFKGIMNIIMNFLKLN